MMRGVVMAVEVVYRAVMAAGFIMEDKNIAKNMLEQIVAFNELKKDMIEHGVNFDGRIYKDKTGLCTVRDCVKCILLSGETNGELCYTEDDVKYNVIIKVIINDNKDN